MVTPVQWNLETTRKKLLYFSKMPQDGKPGDYFQQSASIPLRYKAMEWTWSEYHGAQEKSMK